MKIIVPVIGLCAGILLGISAGRCARGNGASVSDADIRQRLFYQWNRCHWSGLAGKTAEYGFVYCGHCCLWFSDFL